MQRESPSIKRPSFAGNRARSNSEVSVVTQVTTKTRFASEKTAHIASDTPENKAKHHFRHNNSMWSVVESWAKADLHIFGKFNHSFESEHSKSLFLVRHPIFRVGMHATIIANVIQMGFAVGNNSADGETLLEILDNIFVAVYALEMVLLMRALGMKEYFSDRWLNLDCMIAACSILDAWILPIFGLSADHLGKFRLLRLLRILKLLRVFPNLFVVVDGLVQSLQSMFWIFVLLALTLYAGAIFCVEIVGAKDAGYQSFDDSSDGIHMEAAADFNNYYYFGSVFRAMYSLFGICLLSEWPIVRPCVDIHYVMVPFFVSFICFVAFGILNVIIGIVVEKTMEAVQAAKEIEIEQKYEKQAAIAESIAGLMFSLDTDGDSRITVGELQAAAQFEEFRNLLVKLDLPHGFGSRELIHMLDMDGNGTLSKKEFVDGILRQIYCTDFQRIAILTAHIGAIHNSINRLFDFMSMPFQSGTLIERSHAFQAERTYPPEKSGIVGLKTGEPEEILKSLKSLEVLVASVQSSLRYSIPSSEESIQSEKFRAATTLLETSVIPDLERLQPCFKTFQLPFTPKQSPSSNVCDQNQQPKQSKQTLPSVKVGATLLRPPEAHSSRTA